MPTIHLTTFIAAPVDVVFDLTRHIGLHKETMSAYEEEIVEGKREGLFEKDDTVTWQARHLFKKRRLQVKVSQLKKNELYVDEQSAGNFKMMKHEHYFKPCDNGTILIDLLHFELPYGILGQWFDKLFIGDYIRRLLEKRIRGIKEYAESEKWKKLLQR